MIVQVVHLEVQPDKLNEFLVEAKKIASESLKEPGITQFDLLQMEDDRHRFMLYEVYNTRQALEAHRQTGHFTRWVEKGVPLLAGERVRVIYQPVP